MFWVSPTSRGKSSDLTYWGVLLFHCRWDWRITLFLFILHHFDPCVYELLTLREAEELRVPYSLTYVGGVVHGGIRKERRNDVARSAVGRIPVWFPLGFVWFFCVVLLWHPDFGSPKNQIRNGTTESSHV